MDAQSNLDMFAAASPERRRTWELASHDDGLVCSLRAGAIHHPMLNRIVVGAPLEAGELGRRVDRELARFRDAGVERYLVQLAAPAPAAWLAERGLAPFRHWVRLGRGAAAPAPAACCYDIVRVGPGRAAEVADTLAAAHGIPREAGELCASIVGRPGWHVYAAIDEGAVVAAGALFVLGQLGYLAMAGTLASHRGRGAQSALIARRIQVALDLGCRSLSAVTGEAAASDRQHSYRNLGRHGFEPVGTIYNYVPADLPRRGRSVDTEARGVCHDDRLGRGARLVRRPSA